MRAWDSCPCRLTECTKSTAAPSRARPAPPRPSAPETPPHERHLPACVARSSSLRELSAADRPRSILRAGRGGCAARGNFGQGVGGELNVLLAEERTEAEAGGAAEGGRADRFVGQRRAVDAGAGEDAVAAFQHGG